MPQYSFTREHCEAALDFHDEMLDGGTLPLDLLEARTDKWITQQKSK